MFFEKFSKQRVMSYSKGNHFHLRRLQRHLFIYEQLVFSFKKIKTENFQFYGLKNIEKPK